MQRWSSFGKNLPEQEIQSFFKKIVTSKNMLNLIIPGKRVERVAKRKQGKFIIFGKAARANALRAKMIKKLTGTKSESKKFAVYGGKAQGQKRADHALSIRVGEDGKVMYDNAFLNVEKKFSVETLALYMEDVCYCYVFDIYEDVK